MKKFLFIGIIASVLVSCHKKEEVKVDKPIITEVEVEKVDTTIHQLDPMDISDTMTVGKHHYQYRIQRVIKDSVDVITDDSNTRYYDNAISLSIARDGEDFFQHRFLKKEFNDNLEKLYREHGILLNMKYDKASAGYLIFKIVIGPEDSETQAIYDIYIANDGSYRFEKGDVFDEDDIDRIEDPDKPAEDI